MYEVRVNYRGVHTYLIPETEVGSREEAAEIAKNRYQNGDDGDSTVSEWEEISDITVDETK